MNLHLAKHMTITFLLALALQQTRAQCSQINIINGENNPVILQYDGSGHLISIAGTDEEDGAFKMKFSVQKGLSLPAGGQKGVKWADNGDGNFIITTSEGEGDDEVRSQFKVSKEGKLLSWDQSQDDGFKTTTYTYDGNGDLLKMTWDGTMNDTKVTDKGELTATFNKAKPGVIMKGAPMIFLAESAWQMLPMTNSHQITSFTYVQTIHMPATQKLTGYQDAHHQVPIYKDVPAKDIKNVITRNFSYTYDAKGRVSSITVTGKGLGASTKTIRITYTECIKTD